MANFIQLNNSQQNIINNLNGLFQLKFKIFGQNHLITREKDWLLDEEPLSSCIEKYNNFSNTWTLEQKMQLAYMLILEWLERINYPSTYKEEKNKQDLLKNLINDFKIKQNPKWIKNDLALILENIRQEITESIPYLEKFSPNWLMDYRFQNSKLNLDNTAQQKIWVGWKRVTKNSDSAIKKADEYLNKFEHSNKFWKWLAKTFGDYNKYKSIQVINKANSWLTHLSDPLYAFNKDSHQYNAERQELLLLNQQLNDKSPLKLSIHKVLSTLNELPIKNFLSGEINMEKFYKLVEGFFTGIILEFDHIQQIIDEHWKLAETLALDEKNKLQKSIIEGCRLALNKYKQADKDSDIGKRRTQFKAHYDLLFLERGIIKESALNWHHQQTKTHHNINAEKARFLPNSEEHLKKLIGKTQQSTVYIGDSFCTNKQGILDERGEQPLAQILDAFYCAYTPSGDLIAAVADGAGGHADAEQDKYIAEMARLSTKKAVHYFSDFDSADALIAGLPWVIEQLAYELKQAQPENSYESAIALAIRTFPINENEVRCVGFNLGDCLLASWDPHQQIIRTLSPAVGSIAAANKKVTPGSLPQNCSLGQVRVIDLVLPKDTVLMPMTDGVYDYLPCKDQDGVTELEEQTLSPANNKDTYYVSYLDDDKVTEIMRNDNNENQNSGYTVINHLLQTLDTKRQHNLEKAVNAQQEYSNAIALLEAESKKDEAEYDAEKLRTLRNNVADANRKCNFTIGDDTTLGALPAQLNSPIFKAGAPLTPANYHVKETNEKIKQSFALRIK